MSEEWINLGDRHARRLLPKSDQRLIAKLEDMEQTLLSLKGPAASAFAKLRDNLAGQPGAASYDTSPGRRSTVFCWNHERELAMCLKAGEPCQGESIDVTDPTGEAGITPDAAQREHDAIATDIKAAWKLIDSIQIRVLMAATGRSSTTMERRAADRSGVPGCMSCARVAGYEPGTRLWQPIHRVWHPAEGDPLELCTWCYRRALGTGRIPSKVECEGHHDVRRTA